MFMLHLKLEKTFLIYVQVSEDLKCINYLILNIFICVRLSKFVRSLIPLFFYQYYYYVAVFYRQ